MTVIIVIDDNDAFRKVLARQLASAGYEVIEAEDGRKGVALCLTHNPALVVCDIFMPGMDGNETIRLIRGEHPAVKIIAASGSVSLDALHELGVDAVLPKPWRRTELLEMVNDLLRA